MGRTIYAEEHLRMYLISLMEPDGYVIGLIMGQSSGQKSYIVHLAKTPPPLTKNVVEETLISSSKPAEQDVANTYIKSVKEIPTSWLADHARHVTKMLPGGMWVLGVFIVGPEDTLDNTSNVEIIKSVLGAIHKTLSSNNKHLYGNNQDEKLILSFNSITQKYVCKSIDVVNDILIPADWKFQEKSTKWHQLETFVDLDRLCLIAAYKNPETLKKQLQNILASVADTIDSSLVFIEEEIRSPYDMLEIISKRKKDSKECKNKKNDNNNSLQVSLYIPCPQSDTKLDIRKISCSASIRLIGQLVSRTFVHQKASIAEANMAVKQDIIRSLASRLEMHWDSLIEEDIGYPEEDITLHELPRRALIALPKYKVTLSDYLFPGEGPEEALRSLQELLDVEVQENQVQKEIELQADSTEFYCQNDVNTKLSDNNTDTNRNPQMAYYFTGITVGLIILVVAILVHQFTV